VIELPKCGARYGPHTVSCSGHQRILVVGGINALNRHRGVPGPIPLKVDSANMGAAIVEAEWLKASVVAWIDKLGTHVHYQAVRIPELGGWRKVEPHRSAAAILKLLVEIEAYAAEQCRVRTEGEPPKPAPWFTALRVGIFTPCMPEFPGAQPDVARWRHWLHHGRRDPLEGVRPVRV
jgi:hypothetical protein